MGKEQAYSFDGILSKLMKYCSYQERSLSEIKQKAVGLGAKSKDLAQLIQILEEDGFYDEKRFVEVYVRGKLKIKRWGKYKIKEGLYSKGVSSENINEGVNAIAEESYLENLKYLIDRRDVSVNPSREEVAKHYRFFLSKGYESYMIKQQFQEKGWM